MAGPELRTSYSWADLRNSDDGEWYELLEGALVPRGGESAAHQSILLRLATLLYTCLDGTKFRVFMAPFPVRLFEGPDDPPEAVTTAVLPDIIVSDEARLDDKGCKGAPDFVIEILSHSTRENDEVRKWMLYEKAGVREYWIVDPELECVMVWLLEGNRFSNIVRMYRNTDRIEVHTLKGCVIDLSQVFRRY